MKQKVFTFKKYFLQTTFAVLSVIGYGLIVFAAPTLGSGGYAPGTELDPDCPPGDVNHDCFVQTGWGLFGNSGTDGGTNNFIGTTDAKDFVIKANNVQIARFGQNGNVAIGSENTTYLTPIPAPIASGANSFAFLGGIASGAYSISAGILGTEASGTGAIAFGQANTASGAGSVVLNGDASTASGLQAFAMQQANTASGKNATAFGSSNTALGENSVTFGLGNIAQSLTETSIGSYGTEYVPANAAHDEWDTSDRLFTIGNGETDMSRSDAFTILKNGKTGIGYDNFETTISDALLQVNGDILSSSLTSCGILETNSSGLFACGTVPEASPITIQNSSSLFSTGLSGTGSGSSAIRSIFLGPEAGNGATNANYAIFLGYQAGSGVTDSVSVNFIGYAAGQNASNASGSVFMGTQSGFNATNAGNSVFLGYQSGAGSTNASGSVFLGQQAGNSAPNARNAIFIGSQAGNSDPVNTFTGGSAILIGTNTSTGGFKDSIALGTDATNTATNQFMIGATTSPIDTTRIEGSASTQCTITTGTGIACTSDERVKTNIEDLSTDILSQLLEVRTVTYNWLQNPEGKQQIGFLAQNLEQHFPQLVETDSKGMKSVYYAQMAPILVEAIKELDLKITRIEALAEHYDQSMLDRVMTWLGDKANGLTKLFTHELCLTDGDQEECLTLDQVRAIKNSLGQSSIPSGPSPSVPDPVPATDSSPVPDLEITPDPDAVSEVVPEPESVPENSPDPVPVPDLSPEIVA